jgi:hypothetical protein
MDQRPETELAGPKIMYSGQRKRAGQYPLFSFGLSRPRPAPSRPRPDGYPLVRKNVTSVCADKTPRPAGEAAGLGGDGAIGAVNQRSAFLA